MNQSDPEASIRAAYIDAKARGLPDCWTCSIDKRNRRKWTAPTGRSCDSIPKALAISVELGLLPPDFPIQSGPNKRKRSDTSAATAANKAKRAAQWKQQQQQRPLSSHSSSQQHSASSNSEDAPRSLRKKALGDDRQRNIDDDDDEDDRKPKAKPARQVIEEEASSSEEEDDDDSFNEAPPEPMNPEISLDGLRRSAAPTTVHWDPTCADGKLVGMSVRVAAPQHHHGNGPDWYDGRAVGYDPFTHKHKIAWEVPNATSSTTTGSSAKHKQPKQPQPSPTSWVWLRNEEHNLHISTRLVWAHVKGYAWWPALVREANTEDTGPNSANSPPVTNRSVKVEFFGTGEVANLKDGPDTLRPFHPLQALDPVVAKHKKKRNAKATALASSEWYAIRHARNQAAIWFARKAWNMANIVSGQVPYLGKQVQVFRDDVNYPYGDTLNGLVHAYSRHQNKWLVSYELSSVKNAKYEASWLNLSNKQVSTRLVSRKAAKQQPPLEDLKAHDLLPFLYGFGLLATDTFDTKLAEELDDDEIQFQMELSELWRERCHMCVEHFKKDQSRLECSVCGASYHLGCCDPPISIETYIRLVKEGKPLVCSRCVTCRGCYQKDIVFGSHPRTVPASLSFSTGESLDLCSMCEEAYNRKQYCPNCAHSWDDVKFNKIRRQIEYTGRNTQSSGGGGGGGAGRKRKGQSVVISLEDSSAASLTGRFSVDLDFPAGAKVDPSWYYPETVEWGWTEIEMLVCDECKVWVHAGCAGLSEDEYNETSDGDHPIFSKEFLCRHCCQQRCTELVLALQQEDRMGIFAVPVSEDAAPNYQDVIKIPMDLQTMLERAERDEEDCQNYAWVREMFELMVLNALTFNNYHTKIWAEAKRFYNDCLSNVFEEIGKAAPPSKYEKAIEKNFAKAEEARKKEEDRVQVDESVEKKDLVAGSMAAASIILPDLRESPPDQPSCVPNTEVQLKSVDAFYSAFLDCCFTCGSSGAADTMLFCVDCGEAYHSFCANAPVHSMTKWAASGWRCPNCKVCEISGNVPEDETRLIYCEMCDRAFSLHLLDPPLEKAPSGLWVCGQCVDCLVCKNTDDPRGASLKHWSKDPQKCFACGGCELLPGSVPACNVCQKLLRDDSVGLVSCVGCGSQVHRKCDPRAEKHARSLENIPRALKAQKVKPPDTYLCPTCYQPAPDNIPQTTQVDRKGAYHLAWKAIESNTYVPDEGQSQLDLYNMFTDRIEFAIRNRWKHEYLAIIEDGMKFYVKAREEDGDPTSVVQLVFNRLVNLPLWKAQRALRFVAMARRKQWETKIDIDSIHKIVFAAKLAAAYIDVACSVMRCDMTQNVRFANRVEALLQPPEEGGVFTLPKDAFEQSVNSSDLDLCDVEASENADDNDSTNKSNKKDDSTSVEMAEPLQGWDDSVDIGQPSEWKDPRECVLCHLCGDDDAGLSVHGKVEEHSRWGLPVHLGRLLPTNEGGWIHTACALWSSEVYEANDGMVHAVERARARGAQLKCFGCGRYGATVGCNKGNCNFNYHFACAKWCGAVFTSDKHVYCANHKPTSGDVLEKESFEIMKTLMVAPDKTKDSLEPAGADLCFRVGAFVVHSLGKIEQKKDGFHSENYITPPGYFATRIFWSTIEPRKRTVYIMQVNESDDGRAEFSIIPTDSASSKIRGSSLSSVYSTLVERVRKVNAPYYSHGDLFATFPMSRKSRRKTFGLNAPQFFGFGLNFVRKKLERLPLVEAVATPLTQSSPSYRFCFVQPDVSSIRDLQRRRAAVKAEMALENSSGCARTEGIKAVTRSGGSGRITRALVRSAEEAGTEAASETTVAKGTDRNVYQAKYKKMKAIPVDQRLAARRSHIHGWGLFTKVEIKKNEPIIEYIGEVLRKPIADMREKQYEISGEGSCYMFRLDLHRIVDSTMIGSMARFMNHSCSSNAYAKIISVDEEKKIVVFANRDIEANEEITYDYKFQIADSDEVPLRCTCGAPNCIGRLN